ncbi:MAG: response regulator transcription factor [Planctomycetaceae bacterium]|nr:response regulator transcription factor [Planctomycetales bacterium]MCB9874801.1 response regulator transcription factor [Planctomycetaceae bacterium]HRX79155.1 response regulator transcription factor [Pirellulaceae bacterium]
MSRVLIVEDNAPLLDSLSRGLREEGHDVLAAQTTQDAFRLASREPLDAIVLDLMLPDGSGLELLRRLRADGFVRPVLVVTARDAVADRIMGLDCGADDYLVKPFDFGELVARLRALLRRNFIAHDTMLRCDNLHVDLLARRVSRAGEEVQLTRRQFELLEYLLRRKDQVVSRDAIARDVWKASTATWTNVIDVQVNHLRKKIERSDWKAILHTVRGVGYVLGDRP